MAQSEAVCAPADENVDVRIWFGRSMFEPDDQFASFREAYPNITVHVDAIPLEQHPSDLVRTFGTAQAPDIIQPEHAEIGTLAQRGLLLDIAPLIENWRANDPELYEAMTPTAWEMASYGGVRHGLALHHGVYWNVYRKDVFEELGIEVPTTWDEVLELSAVIAEAKGDEGMFGYTMHGSNAQLPVFDMARFAQMGGQWVDGVMQIDSEAGHYWLRWMQDAVATGAVSPNTIAFEWPDAIANFRSGQAAMAMISRNVYPNDIAPHLQYGEEWEIIPYPLTAPGHEDAARYVTNGWPYVVSAGTQNPCEVGLVLQYLASDEQAFSVARRYQPVSNARVMASDEYLEVAPWGRIVIDAWEELDVAPYHANQVAMNRVIRDAMQEALRNPQADTAQMAREFQQQLDQLATSTR